jgi:hypothetical protein
MMVEGDHVSMYFPFRHLPPSPAIGRLGDARKLCIRDAARTVGKSRHRETSNPATPMKLVVEIDSFRIVSLNWHDGVRSRAESLRSASSDFIAVDRYLYVRNWKLFPRGTSLDQIPGRGE